MFRLSLFILAVSIGLTMLVVPRAAPRVEKVATGEQSFKPPPAQPPSQDDPGEAMSPSWDGATEITRDPSGQFYLDGQINQATARFLVDTGADMVALTIDDARRAGLWIDPTSFTVVGAGASGAVRGKQYRVDRLTVAGRTLSGVDVVVLDGLGTNLLGQSVLRRFDKVELNGDKMTLR